MAKEKKLFQRVLAWIGIILLLALYIATFVAALTSSPSANGWFLASLTLTIIIPVAIYVMIWLKKVFDKSNHSEHSE